MTAPRVAIVALVVAVLAFDLVRLGSLEYAYRAEMARAETEIGILRRHRADLRVGTQQRLIASVGRSRVDAPERLAHLELRRESTPWEDSTGLAERLPSALAVARAETTIGRVLGEWLDLREGAGEPP
jgi:hypothetical protein